MMVMQLQWKWIYILTNGSSASRSLILLPLRFKCDNFGQSLRTIKPVEIRLSLSSSCGNEMRLWLFMTEYLYSNILNFKTGYYCTIFFTFWRFGNLGNPFKLVKPTFIKLRLSKAIYSSVRPSICVDRVLSRIKSLTWNTKLIVRN